MLGRPYDLKRLAAGNGEWRLSPRKARVRFRSLRRDLRTDSNLPSEEARTTGTVYKPVMQDSLRMIN